VRHVLLGPIKPQRHVEQLVRLRILRFDDFFEGLAEALDELVHVGVWVPARVDEAWVAELVRHVL